MTRPKHLREVGTARCGTCGRCPCPELEPEAFAASAHLPATPTAETARVLEIRGDVYPGRLLNVNDLRGHTKHLAALHRPWRQLGCVLGRDHRLPHPFVHPVRIWAEFRFPTNHQRDTPNLYPTVKALVDGLQDAGVLLGDHDNRVEGPWLKRTYPNGPTRLRLVLVPLPGGRGLGTEYPEETP